MAKDPKMLSGARSRQVGLFDLETAVLMLYDRRAYEAACRLTNRKPLAL